MHDLPHGPALLRLAREVLLDELLPLLPEERRLDARLVANAMAVAERGAEVSFVPILAELQSFYGEGTQRDLPRRFASDLRAGAFEGSASRDGPARALLWHLTIVRLRESNPRFLAANGVS
jgi:hypothetical protein